MDRQLAKSVVWVSLMWGLAFGSESHLHAYGRSSVGTTAAQFLKLGTNARGVSMGEAYSAVCDGSESIYWNPAGLDGVDRHSFSLMHAVFFQDISYDFASYAQRFGKVGVLGLGLQYLNAGNIDRTDRFGTSAGSYNPNDLAVTLGWAREFRDLGGEDYVFGFSGKYIQSKLIETAKSGAVDAGLLWSPSEIYTFSLSLHNMGAQLKFRNESDGLPFNVKFGSSYRFMEGLLLALDLAIPNDDHVNVSLGAEYKRSIARDLWAAPRAGFNSKNAGDLPGLSSISAGAGFGWKNYSLDFSWQPFGYLGNSYLVSLSGKF